MKQKIFIFGKRVFTPVYALENAVIIINKGKIIYLKTDVPQHEVQHLLACENESKCEFIFAETVAPGYLDIHIQGCYGYDFIDTDRKGTQKLLEGALLGGCTSVLPTISISAADANLKNFKKVMAQIAENKDYVNGASIPGIHLEGPYINPKKKGGFPLQFVKPPSLKEFKKILKIVEDAGGPGFFKMITIAPELDGSEEVIKEALEAGITVSLGHSEAGYDLSKKFFDMGVDHITHTFNAMNGLNHREPGLIGAALDDDGVFCQIIPDGIHIHPAVLRILHKIKEADRLAIISDATAPCGMPDGTVIKTFNGESTIKVENGAVRNTDGTLAGSALLMETAVKKYAEYTGTTLNEIFTMASLTPLASFDVKAPKELIKPGAKAELLILDEELTIKKIIHKNRVIEKQQPERE